MTHFINRLRTIRDTLLASFETLQRIRFSAPWINSRPHQG